MTSSLLILLFLAGGLAQTQGAPAAGAAGAAAAAPLTAPEWITTAGATTKTVCSLSMQGYGDKPGLKAVQLSCTGGTVTARAHKVLKQFWGPKLPKQGVVWTEDEECRPATTGCLLTICNKSDAVLFNAKITSVQTAPGAPRDQGDKALCISNGSRVTLRNCTFSSSTIQSLATYDNTTSVLLDQCSITNNNMIAERVPSGVFVEDAAIVVRSSVFANNKAQKILGSTIAARGYARVSILDSAFLGNTGFCGAALHALGNAQAAIQGGRFEANTARIGGAICTADQAVVNISPGEQPDAGI